MYKVALIGCGNLGGIVARGLRDGKVPGCELVAVLGRDKQRAESLAADCGCAACFDIESFLAFKPDFVLEAATGEALKAYAVDCLNAGCSMVCLSVGALADEVFYQNVEDAAAKNGVKLYVAPGVIGGLDLAGSAMMAGELQGVLTKYHYSSQKSQLPDVYDGSTREAIEMSPRHLNIAVAAGLACGSLDKTRIRLDIVPPEEEPGFTLEMQGEFGSAKISCSRAGRGPALAAYSALAVLKRITSNIVF